MLGTTVFPGMLVGTIISVLTIPEIYFVVQTSPENVGRKKPETAATPTSDTQVRVHEQSVES